MSKKRIVIIGGGFAGIFTAKTLRKIMGERIEIELINLENYFVFQPLLPEVAAGGINTSDAITSIRLLLKGVQFRKAEVMEVDFQNQKLTVLQGTRRLPIDVHYDHLVIAMGQSADLTQFPGLSDHALTMKYLGDAFKLRNHIIGCLENADVAKVPEVKQQLLNFVVVGAGFSGVETVGEIMHMIDNALKFYPNISRREISVKLIEYADRILLELPESLSSYAQKQLEKNGVEVITGVGMKSATGRSAELTNGETIPTRTVLATIGTGPNKLVKKLGLEMEWGKIKVNRACQVENQTNVWAVGDAALIPLVDEPSERHDFAPPTAQFAYREGVQLGQNIARVLKGEEVLPFAYSSKGALASLGASKAVAAIGRVKMSGFWAWVLWRSFYLSFLPGWGTRIRVMVNWLLQPFVTRNTAQIEPPTLDSTRYMHFRKGDHVFEPGMVADGFYTVISGGFELELAQPGSGETLHRKYGPGDHFGERIILGRDRRTGRVTATEDSITLWVARDDFKRFSQGFPVLDDYFQDYIRDKFGDEAVSADQDKMKA